MLSAPATPDRGSPVADAITAEQDRFRSALTRTIDDFLTEQRSILGEISEESLPLISSIATLTGGGKRVRALLCYWGWRAAGGSAEASSPVVAGTALEFFQAAALIHDDIIDRSDTRRGRPSVHRQFTTRHTEHGWHLDPDRFGTSAAILAGDLCLAFSEELFTASCAAVAGRSARTIFNRMRTEVMAGQYLDLLEEAVGPDQTPAVAEERALNILRFKSAKYSMERPLMLGGALAGADAALLSTYSAFALPLGEAFQLRDDVLGVFGDPEVTGKPAGDDLREGKRTLLIARTLRAVDDDVRATINTMLGNPGLDPHGVGMLRGLITDSGALASTEELIAEKSRQAFDALALLEIDEHVRQALHLLATAMVARSA